MGFRTEVTMDSIDDIETGTLFFVDKTIASLEAAMAGLKSGDEESAAVFGACRALRRWKDGFLARDRDEAFEARVARLRELADICSVY